MQVRSVPGVVGVGKTTSGSLDRGVGEGGLQSARHPFPLGPVEPGQDLLVDVPAVVGETFEARVLRAESHEEGELGAQERVEHAFVAREGLVAVLRDRLPQGLPWDPCPPPLPAVTVPVVHEMVHEARLQVGGGVRPHVGALPQALPHLGAVDRLRGSGETGAAGPLLDVAHDVGELRPELAQPRIVRHDDQEGRVVEHARPLEQAGSDHRSRGMGRGHLVDEETPRERLPQVDGKELLGFLDRGAERVGAPVPALEGEGSRLARPHPPGRGQAAAEGPQVEDGKGDGSGEEAAVAGPPQPPPEKASPETRPHDDRALRGRRRGSRRVVGPRRLRAARPCNGSGGDDEARRPTAVVPNVLAWARAQGTRGIWRVRSARTIASSLFSIWR